MLYSRVLLIFSNLVMIEDINIRKNRFHQFSINVSNEIIDLNVVFDNFVVEQREEFLACDTTCVIGELGGNLGFFLGGSILALFDVIVNVSTKISKKLHFRKTLD